MDNKTTLQKANAAITNGDYETFLSFCTEDIQWTFVGDTVLTGKQAVRDYMTIAYAEPPEFMVENLIAEGDFVTAIGKISMRTRMERKSTILTVMCGVFAMVKWLS